MGAPCRELNRTLRGRQPQRLRHRARTVGPSIYEQWYFRKVRKEVRDEVREVHDLTQRLEAATERLNKANADAEAARLRSRPK